MLTPERMQYVTTNTLKKNKIMNDRTLESSLVERRLFKPNEAFQKQANLNAESLQALYDEADADNESFWGNLAREKLKWIKEFSVILDASKAPHFNWFSDGQMNVSANCIDRHLDARGDQTAIIFEK